MPSIHFPSFFLIIFLFLFIPDPLSCGDHLANNQFVVGPKDWLIKIVTPVSISLTRETEHKQEQFVYLKKEFFFEGESNLPPVKRINLLGLGQLKPKAHTLSRCCRVPPPHRWCG